MADYVSVPIRREVFEELRRLKEKLGFRSYGDVIKYLIDYMNRPITIEVTDRKLLNPPTVISYGVIMDAVRDGRSVIFNVKIDSRRKKIYVTKHCTIVNNIVDVDGMW